MTLVRNLRLIKNRDDPQYVYIGRGPGSCHMLNTKTGNNGWLGNPHTVHERAVNIAMFKNDFLKRIDSDEKFRASVVALIGKTLLCFCYPQPCHGDVIAAWLDEQEAV